VNAVDVLMYGQRTVRSTIDRYTPADWERIALGVWTATDLVGHLGAFEVRFLEIVQLFVGEEPATNLRERPGATFNDEGAAERKAWPVERVVAELRDAHAGIMARIDRIPAETWREVGTIPWYGPEYALEDFVVYNQYGHKREDAPQLSAVLEARGD
jgi:hypothetical protein